MAEAMAAARRPSVIWLPFQECTGCTESITRSHSPTIEGMIFDMISLDYQETLMAAAGHQAEEALHAAMQDNAGKYLLIVDGSIPLGQDGAYSCIGGRSNVDILKEAAAGAAAVIAVGSCASFGGIPKANPNPTDIPVLFFSRRIGLGTAGPVPINVGARLSGKTGRYSVGVIQRVPSARAPRVRARMP